MYDLTITASSWNNCSELMLQAENIYKKKMKGSFKKKKKIMKRKQT